MKLEKQLLNKSGLGCLLLLISFASCKQEQVEKEKPLTFELSDSMANKIQLSTVELETVENELKLTAKVEANLDKLVDVYAWVGGRVNGLKVNLGDFVSKGQTLAFILSGDVASSERDLLAAESNLNNATRKYNAANDMFKSGLVSEKDLVQSKSEVNLAEAELAKAKELQQLYGSKSKGYYEVKAPISGYVIKKNITDNEDVKSDNALPIFTIADLSEVWVMANVYESDIPKIKEGYDAHITTIAYPDSIIYGKVDKLFSILDPESKIMKARITLKNTSAKLKPEMFAQVILKYHNSEKKLAVPSSAVIFDKSRNYVMVYKNKNDIETRQIEIFQTTTQKTYINSGIKEGEKIISKYQLLVYDAIND
ncbi:MAG: efflux RND transporter periplasmic adaptor subunit [Bacteroidetes bacterium]|nr:efflux RND transporter periplasmic adaptor subunit [Bacteroidota bacterium]